jgi:hypothetical protein
VYETFVSQFLLQLFRSYQYERCSVTSFSQTQSTKATAWLMVVPQVAASSKIEDERYKYRSFNATPTHTVSTHIQQLTHACWFPTPPELHRLSFISFARKLTAKTPKNVNVRPTTRLNNSHASSSSFSTAPASLINKKSTRNNDYSRNTQEHVDNTCVVVALQKSFSGNKRTVAWYSSAVNSAASTRWLTASHAACNGLTTTSFAD